MENVKWGEFHTKNAIENLASLFAVESRFAAGYRPRIVFVQIGKYLRGGTHAKVKAFAIEGIENPSLRNVTGHLCCLAGIKLDMSDLSMVVHRDTIMFRNMADRFPELATLKDMKIDWQ